MPIIHRVAAFTTIALLTASAFAAGPTTSPYAPLPRPPLQNQPWTQPKTDLPANLLSATDLLFKLGMADPRGCQYREIQVVDAHNWNGLIKTHGWLLPEQDAKRSRLAICWDGLIYPVVSVGNHADLRADVAAFVAADKGGVQNLIEGQIINFPLALTSTGNAENLLVCCLLLRLGEADLAELRWKQHCDDDAKWAAEWAQSTQPASQPGSAPTVAQGDPYLNLASQWARFALDRIIQAHQSGDTAVSLETAKLLSEAAPPRPRGIFRILLISGTFWISYRP
jgi:hypothetical protein